MIDIFNKSKNHEKPETFAQQRIPSSQNFPYSLFSLPSLHNSEFTSAPLSNETFTAGTFPYKSLACRLCPNINSNPTITGPKGVSLKISIAIYLMCLM